jgi:hypothetical protein
MGFRTRLAATIGAVALTLVTAGPSLAATTSNADVDVKVNTIDGATVSVTIAETTAFNDVTYNLTTPVPSYGRLTVTVLDNRGTAGGWTVSLKATDFKRTNTSVGADIAVSNFSLVPASPGRVSGVGAIPTTTFAQSPVQSSSTNLWKANANQGDGEFALPLNGTLSVPAGTLVDTYTSTVTADITAAP